MFWVLLTIGVGVAFFIYRRSTQLSKETRDQIDRHMEMSGQYLVRRTGAGEQTYGLGNLAFKVEKVEYQVVGANETVCWYLVGYGFDVLYTVSIGSDDLQTHRVSAEDLEKVIGKEIQIDHRYNEPENRLYESDTYEMLLRELSEKYRAATPQEKSKLIQWAAQSIAERNAEKDAKEFEKNCEEDEDSRTKAREERFHDQSSKEAFDEL